MVSPHNVILNPFQRAQVEMNTCDVHVACLHLAWSSFFGNFLLLICCNIKLQEIDTKKLSLKRLPEKLYEDKVRPRLRRVV